MTIASRKSRSDGTSSASGRIASRQELTRFYQAIGIPAVISATQASKMTAPARKSGQDLPAFLRDAHAIG